MDLPKTESVRAQVLERLRALSEDENARRSQAVCSRLIEGGSRVGLGSWNGKRVGLYRSLRSEIQLASLEDALLRMGARLCYPKITDSKRSLMKFVHVSDPAHPESFSPGPYGVIEPTSSYDDVAEGDLDVIIVPGLAFGRNGERIGRGKGHYDRYLRGISRALRIALAFDFQLFPALSQNSWDQPVHRVLTETEEVVIR